MSNSSYEVAKILCKESAGCLAAVGILFFMLPSGSNVPAQHSTEQVPKRTRLQKEFTGIVYMRSPMIQIST